MLHASTAGEKILKFQEPSDPFEVYELKSYGHGTREIRFNMEEGETKTFCLRGEIWSFFLSKLFRTQHLAQQNAPAKDVTFCQINDLTKRTWRHPVWSRATGPSRHLGRTLHDNLVQCPG